MFKLDLSGIIALSLVVVACGPVTPQDYCQHQTDVLCERIYECSTADERKKNTESLGTTVAECKQKFNAYNQIDCASMKSFDDLCRGGSGSKFNQTNYNTCYHYIATAACKDVFSGSGNEKACSQICE